jgi:hypothetical protein
MMLWRFLWGNGMFLAPKALNKKCQKVSMWKRFVFLSVLFALSLLMTFFNFGFAAQPPDQTRLHIEGSQILVAIE